MRKALTSAKKLHWDVMGGTCRGHVGQLVAELTVASGPAGFAQMLQLAGEQPGHDPAARGLGPPSHQPWATAARRLTATVDLENIDLDLRTGVTLRNVSQSCEVRIRRTGAPILAFRLNLAETPDERPAAHGEFLPGEQLTAAVYIVVDTAALQARLQRL